MEIKKYKGFNYTVRKGDSEVFYAEAYDEGGTEIISNGKSLMKAAFKVEFLIDDYWS